MSIPMPLEPLADDSDGKRLWIGNLDPRVTEFHLLKLLQQHGAIEKFDFMFHRSGPLEGQPRGYAFVTYSSPTFAKIAQETLNGKTLGDRVLSVKLAYHKPKETDLEKHKSSIHIPALAGTKGESSKKNETTIKAITAKLKAMEEATFESFEVNNKPTTSSQLPKSAKLKHSRQKALDKYYKPYLRPKFK